MSPKWINRLLVAGLIAGILLLGAFREFTFVNINFQLQYTYYQPDYYKVHSFFHFLNSFEYTTLYNSKWILTVAFSILFFALTTALIWLLFRKKKLLWLTAKAHAIIFLTAALSYAFGWLFSAPDAGYEFARIFMGLLQSPVIAMVLIPAFKLAEKRLT